MSYPSSAEKRTEKLEAALRYLASAKHDPADPLMDAVIIERSAGIAKLALEGERR